MMLIVACFGIALADSSSQPNPAFTPLAPNLAETETRLLPTNYDVWACDWAPNGKTLVFAGKIQGEDSIKMRLWRWQLEPVADPAPFTNAEPLMDFSPRWSPDGSKIVYTKRNYTRNGPSSNFTSSIWVREVDSGAVKQITTGPEDRDPVWSPDGSQVVFCRGYGPYRSQVVALNIVTGSINALAGKEGELLNSPWYGKNGKVYFAKQTPATRNVVVGNQTYQVMDFGKGSIWAFDPATNTVEPVLADEYDNRQPVVSPDGTKLAFVSDRFPIKDSGNGKFDRGSLFIKDLSSGAIYFVTSKVGLNGGALSWSPDGKKIAFFTFRSIRPAVWVINLP